MGLEVLLVGERVVVLGIGHRARLEPAVEHLGDAPQRAVARGTGDLDRVDDVLVQIVDLLAAQFLELGAAAHADHLSGFLVAPDRQRRAPVPVAADRPVGGALQPLAEAAVLDVFGDPPDLLVSGQHLLLDLLHLDEPGGNGAVDQRCVAAPAEGIVVDHGALGEQLATVAQAAQDVAVHLLDEPAFVVGYFAGKAAVLVDRADHGQALLQTQLVVVLAKARGRMHDSRALFHRDEIRGHHPEGSLLSLRLEIGKERLVGHLQQFVDRLVVDPDDLFLVLAQDRFERRPGQDELLVVLQSHPHVRNLAPDCQTHIRRQGPRRGGPRQDVQLLGSAHLETHGDRRILSLLVPLVDLEVGQRRGAARAVGQRFVPLVDQIPVPQRLESPPDRLHELQIHGAVLVRPVHPAADPLDETLPLARVAQHQITARLVERAHPIVENLAAGAESQLLFGLVLHRQAVAVPAEAPFHAVAAHGPVARHHVLDDRGQQMAVVRQAAGKGRAVVEGEDPVRGTPLHGFGKGVDLLPESQDLLLLLGKTHLGGNLGKAFFVFSRLHRYVGITNGCY